MGSRDRNISDASRQRSRRSVRLNKSCTSCGVPHFHRLFRPSKLVPFDLQRSQTGPKPQPLGRMGTHAWLNLLLLASVACGLALGQEQSGAVVRLGTVIQAATVAKIRCCRFPGHLLRLQGARNSRKRLQGCGRPRTMPTRLARRRGRARSTAQLGMPPLPQDSASILSLISVGAGLSDGWRYAGYGGSDVVRRLHSCSLLSAADSSRPASSCRLHRLQLRRPPASPHGLKLISVQRPCSLGELAPKRAVGLRSTPALTGVCWVLAAVPPRTFLSAIACCRASGSWNLPCHSAGTQFWTHG